ncbi:hypothetical protein ACH5RR_021721 [Cinchona calisaya]|uniref:RBR-type E3 ubiquitin transferase n=1 Tax=Cinchona calisaya TaxID=153742 RepID=A0ABD2ZI59_9GENT
MEDSEEGDYYYFDDEEFNNNNEPEEDKMDEDKGFTVLKLEDEEWFADEEKVRKASGLSEKNNYSVLNFEKTRQKNFFCGICLEKYDKKKAVVLAVACGHLFCKICWKSYIRISINDGRSCLLLKCPQQSCGTVVDQDMINSLASKKEKKKFENYIVRTYVEDKKNIKWCPAPGCDFAVEFSGGNSSNFGVTCDCSRGFCWNCSEVGGRNTGGFDSCNKFKKGREFREAELDLKKLSQIQAESQTMLKFIIDAWDQIVECRRVLKWSYAYGYYLPEEERAKKELSSTCKGKRRLDWRGFISVQRMNLRYTSTEKVLQRISMI